MKPPKEPCRVHRTGRDRQFNIRAKIEIVEQLLQTGDEREVTLGGPLEHALDTIVKAGGLAH